MAELERRVGEETRFAKVMMKLGDVLNGDFFTHYVKRGVLLLFVACFVGEGG